MNGINEGFYFVCDKIIELQAYFLKEAWVIGRVVMLIALLSMALNYGLTGTGLKESIIKLLKAFIFFAIIMGAYPTIIGWITEYTFQLAEGSTYNSMSRELNLTRNIVDQEAQETLDKEASKKTYSRTVLPKSERYWGPTIQKRVYRSPSGKEFSYSTVAPAAMLQAMLLVAGECMRGEENVTLGFGDFAGRLGMFFKGLVCAIFIIVCGGFALLEYLIAFLEFIFVSSVGIICFPLSMWDGSKFMAEKFISAIIGFFIKLLFCTVCVFLALYGFLSLAKLMSRQPFMGLSDQIIMIIITCLLFFYLCKSAPQLAQSLMTGAPSLNAAGAIGTAVMAAGAFAGVAGMGARAAIGGTAAVSSGVGAAAQGAASGHGVIGKVAGAVGGFSKSMVTSGGEAVRSMGADLTRSLVAHSPGGKDLLDRPEAHQNSATARFFKPDDKGNQKSIKDFAKEEFESGKKT